MQNFDLGVILGEIKAEQAKIIALLMERTTESSKPKIYTLTQLEQILQVSKRTIATWLKSGILPHSRVAGKIWVTEEQLKKFIEINAANL